MAPNSFSKPALADTLGYFHSFGVTTGNALIGRSLVLFRLAAVPPSQDLQSAGDEAWKLQMVWRGCLGVVG